MDRTDQGRSGAGGGEPAHRPDRREIRVGTGRVVLCGDLAAPAEAHGLVLFAHGSGSSRHSPRNRYVAGRLEERGLATCLIDLLDVTEEDDRRAVFDIELLAGRLAAAEAHLRDDPEVGGLPLGLFGASTGAAAALVAASRLGERVRAVVSRGGRPDLAGPALPAVRSPTLLIVGGEDGVVVDLNRNALSMLGGERQLVIVPGAGHLFEEPGALEAVAGLAADWFAERLR